MEGGTKRRSVYHPDRVPAFRQNTMFSLAHPLLLTPATNIHCRSFSKKSRWLNCKRIKVIHNSHGNSQVTVLALEKFFPIAYSESPGE